MRILVFQQAAWEDTNAVGNTLSNWFSSWDDVFYNFYTRKQVPNNPVVKEYYTISALDVVKGIVRHRKFGRRFSAESLADEPALIAEQHKKEQQSIDKLHRTKNEIVYWGMESVWRTKKWMDSDFKTFIADANPDILFAFCTSVYILAPLIKYVKEKTNAKIVLYIADDVYGEYKRKLFLRKSYLLRLFRQCIESADRLYGVSEELCAAYAKEFGKDIIPLYKGCTIDASRGPKEWGSPLKIVYAGNLLYGRADTLAHLAECLREINRDGVKAQLEIYTGTAVTEEMRQKLTVQGSSEIVGKRPFAEIRRILSEADIVLHVESFEKEQMESVRYSFSTKIIDCLESGSLVLGIGPKEVSSIKYIAKIPGAYTAADLSDLQNTIQTIIDLPNARKDRDVKSIREFAEDKHEIGRLRARLRADFCELIEKA